MEYIKCKSCKHHNSLSSEFLVFCESCGKKLYPNFKDWSKNNTDKSFDDFVALSCQYSQVLSWY